MSVIAAQTLGITIQIVLYICITGKWGQLYGNWKTSLSINVQHKLNTQVIQLSTTFFASLVMALVTELAPSVLCSTAQPISRKLAELYCNPVGHHI